MDYASLLYGPVYDTLGVPAMLTLDGTDAEPFALTVLDKTAGEMTDGTEGGRRRFHAEIETVVPAARVRATELAEKGVALDDLGGSTLAFNGKSWLVETHGFRPSPNGEGDGEIILFLAKP